MDAFLKVVLLSVRRCSMEKKMRFYKKAHYCFVKGKVLEIARNQI